MLLYPDYRFQRIVDITADDLRKMGVKGFAIDLDNTTAVDHTDQPLDGVVEWIKSMKEEGFKVILLSNGGKPRAERFAKALGEIEWIGFALKPTQPGYWKAKKRLGLKAKEMAMIGDQVFTDVLGANIAGMISIYVYPFAPEERSVRSFAWKRKIEKKLFQRQDAKSK